MNPRTLGLAASAAFTVAAAYALATVRAPVLPILAVLGGTAMVGVSVVAATLALALRDRWPVERTLVRVGAGLAGLAAVAGVVLVAAVGVGGAAVTVLLLGLLGFQMGLPLAVGFAAARRSGAAPAAVVLAWPAAVALGWLLFLLPAPGGVDPFRYNATFLAAPWRSLVLSAVGVVTVFGPAAGVLLLARLRS